MLFNVMSHEIGSFVNGEHHMCGLGRRDATWAERVLKQLYWSYSSLCTASCILQIVKEEVD